MTALPVQIDAYPTHLEQRGGSVDLVKAELMDLIKHAIRNHPRSLQKQIGPSEIGHPCARYVGYKLTGHDKINVFPDVPWFSTIGVAGHAWLEEQFTQANAGSDAARWLTEMTVAVGDVNGLEVTGSCDLYDRATATVVDWKIVGSSSLRKYRSKGPGDQYRSQIHLYGRGFARRGMPVDNVAVAFLPRNEELRNAYIWHEPYDEQIALAALQRANGIALAMQALGPAGLVQLGTADTWCQRCPFFLRDSTDPAAGCPGDPGMRQPGNPFSDLLPTTETPTHQ